MPSFIFLVIAIVAVGILLLIAMGITRKRAHVFDVEEYQTKWLKIENSLVRDDPRSYPLAVIEAALLAEGGLLPLCDTVWDIYADEPTRIRRLMAARDYSEERCRAIIGRQKSEKDFAAIADHTVDNSGSPEETERQIRQLLAVCPGREV